MKLVEHLEYILGLLERGASHSEIKGALLAMREEADGSDRATDKIAKLTEEKAKLQNQVEQFVAISKMKPIGTPGVPPMPPNII